MLYIQDIDITSLHIQTVREYHATQCSRPPRALINVNGKEHPDLNRRQIQMLWYIFNPQRKSFLLWTHFSVGNDCRSFSFFHLFVEMAMLD